MITKVFNKAKTEKVRVKWTVNNAPVIDPRDGSAAFKMMEDQVFKAIIRGIEYTFIIKKGYIYDGASVPALATFLSNLIFRYSLYPDGALRNPSPAHDAIYENEGWITLNCEFIHVYLYGERVDLYISREEADNLFLAMMQQDNLIPEKVQKTVHWFLKNFGWTVWNEKKMLRKRRKK